jgi:uncharacterized protein with HEPN domain
MQNTAHAPERFQRLNVSISPPEYIRHILDEVDYILGQISNLDYDSFVRDETLKRAFVRSIEVIGEASKKLPDLCVNLQDLLKQIE